MGYTKVAIIIEITIVLSVPKNSHPNTKNNAQTNDKKQCNKLTLKNLINFFLYSCFCLEYLRSATDIKPKSAYFDRSEKNKAKDKIPKPAAPNTLANITVLSNWTGKPNILLVKIKNDLLVIAPI